MTFESQSIQIPRTFLWPFQVGHFQRPLALFISPLNSAKLSCSRTLNGLEFSFHENCGSMYIVASSIIYVHFLRNTKREKKSITSGDLNAIPMFSSSCGHIALTEDKLRFNARKMISVRKKSNILHTRYLDIASH